MRFGLSEDEIGKIRNVFSKFPQVNQAIIFGSRAKGNHRPYSDVDLSITGENITLQLLYDIQLQLEDLMLPYIFDINIKEKIRESAFVEHIERVGIVFYQKHKG